MFVPPLFLGLTTFIIIWLLEASYFCATCCNSKSFNLEFFNGTFIFV